MNRRAFLAGVAIGLGAVPRPAAAPPRGRVRRMGFLSGGARPGHGAPPAPRRQALTELGYVEGQNAVHPSRWADARQERLPGLAAELVGLNTDIVTVGGRASSAARRARPPLPVVMALVGDADGSDHRAQPAPARGRGDRMVGFLDASGPERLVSFPRR
jgi:putative ABC transport system substrate-binding protein